MRSMPSCPMRPLSFRNLHSHGSSLPELRAFRMSCCNVSRNDYDRRAADCWFDMEKSVPLQFLKTSRSQERDRAGYGVTLPMLSGLSYLDRRIQRARSCDNLVLCPGCPCSPTIRSSFPIGGRGALGGHSCLTKIKTNLDILDTSDNPCKHRYFVAHDTRTLSGRARTMRDLSLPIDPLSFVKSPLQAIGIRHLVGAWAPIAVRPGYLLTRRRTKHSS
jgi:hypothetical protein